MKVDLKDHYDRLAGRKKRYDGANVRFVMETVEDKDASRKAGRPMMKDVEVLLVQYPGGDLTAVQVNERVREEYAELYAKFKAGQEQPTEGTALKVWPLATRAVVENLATLGIHTVEQLAKPTGEVKKKLGGLAKLCKDAEAWLAAADSDQNQVAALNKQLADTEAKLKRTIEQLDMALARIDSLEGGRLSRDAA